MKKIVTPVNAHARKLIFLPIFVVGCIVVFVNGLGASLNVHLMRSFIFCDEIVRIGFCFVHSLLNAKSDRRRQLRSVWIKNYVNALKRSFVFFFSRFYFVRLKSFTDVNKKIFLFFLVSSLDARTLFLCCIVVVFSCEVFFLMFTCFLTAHAIPTSRAAAQNVLFFSFLTL